MVAIIIYPQSKPSRWERLLTGAMVGDEVSDAEEADDAGAAGVDLGAAGFGDAGLEGAEWTTIAGTDEVQ